MSNVWSDRAWRISMRLLAGLLFMWWLMPVVTFAAEDDKTHILLLNSYNHGYAWTDNEVKGIQQALAHRDDIVLRIEYMDTKVINDAAYYQALVGIYAQKYKALHIDVIITTDDEALNFMRQFRDQLFPDVPLVFTGVNRYKPDKTLGMANVTGINEEPDFAANLKLIKHLLPGVQEVIVIHDSLRSGQTLRREFDDAVQSSDVKGVLGLKFSYLSDLSLQEMETRLSQLQPHQAVFYLSFFQDGNGIPYAPSEVLPVLSRASSVPVFGALDYMIGKGIVGGLLETAHEQGQQAALLVEKILAGVSADSLPVTMHSSHLHGVVFDYHQLQRFGFSEHQLPQGSVLVNEPETFYYRYKQVIWVTVIVFSVLLAYIGALLINLRHRARTEKGLQSILESTHTLFDVQTQQFKQRLRDSVGKVLPEACDILLMRYKGRQDHFDEAELVLVDTAQSTVFDETAKHLIADAVTENRCTYSKQRAVATLASENSPVNLLYVNGKRNLDKTDQQLFELFAGNVSMSIDNAETYKLSASLQAAHRIQHAMLPTDFVSVGAAYCLDLHAFVEPAKEVGGDLYDFFALDEEHVCLLVGDVSGKGIPAAIFMAMAKTVLRATADIALSPAEMLARANNELSRNNPETMFVTLFLVVYNTRTGQLRYADGGHNAPYVLSAAGGVNVLKAPGGTALGVMEDLPYFNGELTLGIGDHLVLYTDGVTEATDEADALYGEKRLEQCLGQYLVERMQSPQGAVNAETLNRTVLADVRRFVGDAAPSDDITSLVIRRVA